MAGEKRLHYNYTDVGIPLRSNSVVCERICALWFCACVRLCVKAHKVSQSLLSHKHNHIYVDAHKYTHTHTIHLCVAKAPRGGVAELSKQDG